MYFTISNLDKSLNWKVAHKFTICLLPSYIKLQEVLPKILQDISCKLPSSPYQLSKYNGDIRNVKVEIARVIGDTPGIADFCGCKNHRSCK